MKSKALSLGLLSIASMTGAHVAHSEVRLAAYSHLDAFVGHWTTEGREGKFLEVCEWYHGQFHVVCNSESQRDDGSTGYGMSILSYKESSGYVYSGIGSRGRYETLANGRWEVDKFVFESRASEEGKVLLNRIVIGPFSSSGFLFTVSTSEDGQEWSEAARTAYVRLK